MAADSPSWGSLLGIGAVVAAALVVGMALGWAVDSAAGTTPIFILIGLAVGLVGAVGYTITEFRKYLASAGTNSTSSDQK